MQRVIEHQGGGRFVSQLQQRNRGVILERNKELRKSPGAVRNASFMGLEFNVPTADYYTILKQIRMVNPGARHADIQELLVKWLNRYGQSYRVRG